ncbi:hypothetical protein GCM10017786_75580 [Amycolatopsis deserti]|uniref:Transposase n=1 Tax=Amycolatopsis deserti TaxID=185696 RepID=A0ABQ3JHR1_9PSEU|nr:hypothetical protein GCM10017786_75580 [Amycolatopsis deserti]
MFKISCDDRPEHPSDDPLAGRRRVGRPSKLTDSALATLAVAQALLGFTSEARWLRFLSARVPGAFRYRPASPATIVACAPRYRWSSKPCAGWRRTLWRDTTMPPANALPGP